MPGTNVLAIQGLNASAADEDFLILPRLIDRDDEFLPGLVRYFSEPTPGAQNGVVTADVGPIISQVSEPAGALAAIDPLLVTATVTPTFEDLGEVLLYYRVMFGQELSVPMLDDGAHGDGLAGDGIFGATIPAGVASTGQMLRYRVAASDSQGNTVTLAAVCRPAGHARVSWNNRRGFDRDITAGTALVHRERLGSAVRRGIAGFAVSRRRVLRQCLGPRSRRRRYGGGLEV